MGFLNIKNSLGILNTNSYALLAHHLPCNSKMIKIKFWPYFYLLPSSFSKNLITQKLTGTTSLVYGITFCSVVIHACILVKILNMVADFRLTFSLTGGKPPFLSGSGFLFGSWLALWILIYPVRTSFTENRKDPIYSKSERKETLRKLLYSALLCPGSSLCLEECPCSMQYVCVCLVQILKHTCSINVSSQSIWGKEVGKDIIHIK